MRGVWQLRNEGRLALLRNAIIEEENEVAQIYDMEGLIYITKSIQVWPC